MVATTCRRNVAVAGLAATEGALRDGAVADLLLVDHPESTLTSFIGPAPEDLAQTTAELADRGVSDPITERADAALARVQKRVEEGGHGVPPDDIRRRYSAGIQNLFGPERHHEKEA